MAARQRSQPDDTLQNNQRMVSLLTLVLISFHMHSNPIIWLNVHFGLCMGTSEVVRLRCVPLIRCRQGKSNY